MIRLDLPLLKTPNGHPVRVATIVTIMNHTDNMIVRGVPVTSTIVDLDDHSLAIVDTGMAENPELLDQLEEMGYQPSDFSLVINTHLHPDHIGGNRHFRNARIIISRRELTYHRSLERIASATGREAAIPESKLQREMRRMREMYRVSDLLGMPEQIEFMENHPPLPSGIKLISAAGHSIDDRVVILQGQTKNVLAAGDALYHRDLWRASSPPGINLDEELFRRNAQLLSEFDGIVIPGHDGAFDHSNGIYLESNKFIDI